jgi:glutamate-1-semialdehyde 2,1-aminomutase
MLNHSNEEYMQIFAFELANRGIYPMFRGQIALSEPMNEDDISNFIQTSKDILESMFTD